MSDTTQTNSLTCYVCCKEITRSAALTPEGMDYVAHFCGPDCYQRLIVSLDGQSRSPADEHPVARQEKQQSRDS